MIEVTLRIDRHGGTADQPKPRYLLAVSGQSAPGPQRDVASLAVCTLMQSMSCYLAAADWETLGDFDLEGAPGSGWCSLLAVPAPAGEQRIDGAFRMLAAGFELLARQFPQRLEFSLKQPPRRPVQFPQKSAADGCSQPAAVVQ